MSDNDPIESGAGGPGWDILIRQQQQLTKPVTTPLLRDLPADEFRKHCELFNGPYVNIEVGEGEATRTFTLPKGLVSYYFKYFASALGKAFKEGIESKVELKEWSPEIFDFVVQWCYNGQLILPETSVPDIPPSVVPSDNWDSFTQTEHEKERTTQANSAKIDLFLDFLVLADYLMITSSIDSIIYQMEDIMCNDYGALTVQHVLKAIGEFASNTHVVRKLFARWTVSYWQHSTKGWGSDGGFKLQKAIENSEGFASDVLRALAESRTHGLEALLEPRRSPGRGWSVCHQQAGCCGGACRNVGW